MSLFVDKSGILDTIQDFGRQNFRSFGINPNGAMDETAARLINILLGNDENEAVLEMHFPPARLLFEEAAVFAVGGANFAWHLNDVPIENWRIYAAKKNDILRSDDKIAGNRAYLSVKGGFEIEKWLGSASTNLQIKIGGFGGEKLASGNRIKFKIQSNEKIIARNFTIAPSVIPIYSRFPTVRVMAGAEFELLTAHSQEIFLKQTFVVSNDSNRMGYRLSGTEINLLHEKEFVSSAVNFGTIQLLPNGQLIILMADHQTSGGYPRIADIIKIDLPLAAQLGANDKIGFHLISVRKAEDLLIEFEKDLTLLKTAIKFRSGG